METKSANLELPPLVEQLIPLDKSWLIRLGVIDLLLDCDDMENFLQDKAAVSTDLLALNRASKQWRNGTAIDVGESGTLYRFLQFASWHMGEDRSFIKTGTLKDRAITQDPSIVNMTLLELLKLDGNTSQWASAAVLVGNQEKLPGPIPFKLQLTYDAMEHWIQARAKGESWTARKDPTIARQTKAYLEWLDNKEMIFEAEQAEDYCFARAFGLITPTEGEARWPSLRQHESDRIVTMEQALTQQTVTSADHRVVQAVAMLKGHEVDYSHPDAVTKSWPNFWRLIETAA